ncbi:heat-shock protein Hsp20, partial [Vibrio natriegens]
LLHIDLEREIPEEQKPRKITINGTPLLESE